MKIKKKNEINIMNISRYKNMVHHMFHVTAFRPTKKSSTNIFTRNKQKQFQQNRIRLENKIDLTPEPTPTPSAYPTPMPTLEPSPVTMVYPILEPTPQPTPEPTDIFSTETCELIKLIQDLKKKNKKLEQSISDKNKNKCIPGLPNTYYIKSKRLYNGNKIIKYNDELTTGPDGYIQVDYNTTEFEYTEEQKNSLKNVYFRYDNNNKTFDVCHIKPQDKKRKRKEKHNNNIDTNSGM